MRDNRRYRLAVRCVPEAQGVIGARTGQQLIVGTIRQAVNSSGVSGDRLRGLAVGGIPNLDRAIRAPAGHFCSIRARGHG